MAKRTITPRLFGLLSVFFAVQLAVSLGNYTSLIYSAVSFPGISKPAFLVTFQTLGSLLAFLLLNVKRFELCRKISLRALLLLNAVFALLSSNFFHFYLWIIFVMARIALSTALTARLQAMLPGACGGKDETQHYSRFMQTLFMLASLVTLSLSPLVQARLGVANVYLIDMAIMLGSLPAAALSGLDRPAAADPAAEAEVPGRLSAAEILSFSPYVVWLWLVAGSFHVIEIPYLTRIVNVSSAQLTGLFFTAGIGAVTGGMLVPKKLIAAHKTGTAVWSALVLSVVSVAYLRTVSLPVIGLILFLFGALNAVFNISVANIIYEKIPGARQTAAFAFYRLNCNLCVIAAAVVMSAVSDLGRAFVGQLALTGIAALLFLGLTAAGRRLEEKTT